MGHNALHVDAVRRILFQHALQQILQVDGRVGGGGELQGSCAYVIVQRQNGVGLEWDRPYGAAMLIMSETLERPM